MVIATEKEREKAERARQYRKKAGEEIVSQFIDFRIGHVEETLRGGLRTVDFVLLDSKFAHVSPR